VASYPNISALLSFQYYKIHVLLCVVSHFIGSQFSFTITVQHSSHPSRYKLLATTMLLVYINAGYKSFSSMLNLSSINFLYCFNFLQCLFIFPLHYHCCYSHKAKTSHDKKKKAIVTYLLTY